MLPIVRPAYKQPKHPVPPRTLAWLAAVARVLRQHEQRAAAVQQARRHAQRHLQLLQLVAATLRHQRHPWLQPLQQAQPKLHRRRCCRAAISWRLVIEQLAKEAPQQRLHTLADEAAQLPGLQLRLASAGHHLRAAIHTGILGQALQTLNRLVQLSQLLLAEPRAVHTLRLQQLVRHNWLILQLPGLLGHGACRLGRGKRGEVAGGRVACTPGAGNQSGQCT